MENKLFFFDSFSNVKYSYRDLVVELNNTKTIPYVIYTDNYFKIFKNIILSIIYDFPVILIDYDFSELEFQKLGLKRNDLSKKYFIEKREDINFIKDFTSYLNKDSKWNISLYTSGTTGVPKKVSHTLQNLTRMVKIDDNKKQNIWGFAYNPTHIAGLQVFFQAFLNLNSIITLFGLPKSRIFELIERFQITNISATPTFFRMLLPFEKSYYSVKRITLGGERFDDKLGKVLRKIFPNAKILNVYASTEAGTVMAAKGEIFEVNEDVKKYVKVLGNELFIHKKLLGNSNLFSPDEDWYRTGDIVEIVNEHPMRIKILNRKNEMINIGGYMVNPNEVEEIINNHPAVVASVVYGKKNSVLGNILFADIKVKEKITEKEIKLFLRDKLQLYKVPRIINFVESFDITRTGKLKRI